MVDTNNINVGDPIKPNLPSKSEIVEFVKDKMDKISLLKR